MQGIRGGGGYLAFAAALLVAVSPMMHAQGILTVTPGSSVTTSAGTGAIGYTGDGGPAISATLASPSSLAYDANGNLFFADAQNHVIREVSKTGQMSTVAGTGIEGYSGDNAAATAAQLDTPTGVAVDTAGNIYIADSHNHRIRKVSGGTIATLAGTGASGFSGDAAAATAAQLSLPSAVAVDASGNVYIADTNNQRIRKIAGGVITTIAGNGEELFAGDGSIATSAVLDSPTGVAVDSIGNVYIADRHNQRIRMVSPSGTISTIAGSGPLSFSGAFAGDGASATAAALSRPSGVSVDAAGNLYVADTGNQRIRQVSSGTIVTVAGNGQQGFGGDSGPAASATLNAPKAVASDALGNLAIADKLNQRLRTSSLSTLTFTNSGVGVLSAPQSVTLANTGSASITVASVAITGAFTAPTGGSCSATPITLAAGATCTQNIALLPTAPGATVGSVLFGGVGIVPQSILLSGTGAQSATAVTLTSSAASPFAGQAITLTATVKPTGIGTATGNVSFYDGATLLGASVLTAGSGSITVTAVAGAHTFTAVYAGDANFTGSTSSALAQVVIDFNFALSAGTPGSKTVEPGRSATFAFTVSPLDGPFTLPVTLSATGLPPGATVSFSPQTITLGVNPVGFTMQVQTAPASASLHPNGLFGSGAVTLSLLLLPFSRSMRRRLRGLRTLTVCVALLLSLAAIGGLTGCGSGSGFFAQPQKSYTMNVTGTATGAGGVTLQHSTTVVLTVQ